MKSKAILTTSIILYSILLYACGAGIPNTGEEIVATENAEEENVTLIPTNTATTVAARPTATPETPACLTPTASIKISSAYLREGPDIRYEGTTRYASGDEFTLLGRYRDWFQAKAADGNQGWLYKDWLTLPSNLDLDAVCAIAADNLVPTPSTQQANPPRPEDPANPTNPLDDDECEPTYYTPCD